MGGQEDDLRTAHIRHWLKLIAGGLSIPAAVAVLLIAAGVFDPQPLGPLLQTDRPGPHALNHPGETLIPATAPWPPDSPPARFSIRLKAAYRQGELDSGFGLALGSGSSRLVVALSPLGYVAVRQDAEDGQPVYPMPWQTWPHGRPGAAENELWLDVDQSDVGRTDVTAWLNRELLWRGELDKAPNDLSLWLSTYGAAVTVDFRSLEWFAAP